MTTPDGTVVTADDGPRAGVTYEAVADLKPVFRPDGLVTAGNCCALNDGAAAVVVMSDTKAAELGLTPLARIVATGVSALSPEIMGLGPVEATRRALAIAGMSIGDIDLVEINEAFAAQVVPSYQDLGIDLDRLNVNGGAIAVGPPLRDDRRPAAGHHAQLARLARQVHRSGHHVRRRRAGHGHHPREGRLTMPEAEEARWLDESQQQSWRALMMGITLLLDRLDADLRRGFDISLAEYEILVRLSERPQRQLRMAQLADAMAHSRSRVTHTVKRMELAGLVSARSLPTTAAVSCA